jgi:hypothetical protein
MEPLERLIALVRRELGAESVRVLDSADQEAEARNVLYARLPDGRCLAVAFAAEPPAKDALRRRLSMLTATFAQSLAARPTTRPPLALSLHEELRALAARANAVDAAVIDAHSPVVWGAGSMDPSGPSPDPVALVDLSGSRLPESSPSSDAVIANLDPDDEESGGDSRAPRTAEHARELLSRAIAVVREMPGLAALRRGGHVAETVRGPDLGVFVRSFASIYLLVLAFDAPFDELRAERAALESQPRVERLVLALPPLEPDPSPVAGVIALRRGRKR